MTATFEELNDAQKERNRSAVADLVKNRIYAFTPAAQTVPLERRIKGSVKAGEMITFDHARYLGWREESQEHMFFATTLDGQFFAPMFICDGGVGVTPCD
jgi:hypothetical protein